MAKQNVSFGERHLEKLVIGVAGVILLAVLFLYVIQNPYSVEVEGTTLGPGAFYSRLDEKVTEAARQLKNASPPAAKPWEAPKLAAAKSADLPIVFTTINPAVPSIDTGIQLGNKVDLVAILPPGKPVGTVGRANCSPTRAEFKIMGEQQPPPETETPPAQDISWIAMFASLNRRAQQEAFMQAKYAVDRQLLVVTRVEAERQRLLPDGSWEEPAQRVDIRYVAKAYGGRPTLEIQDANENPTFAQEDYTYIEQLKQEASKDQALILRPDFQKNTGGDVAEWKVPAQMEGGQKFDWQEYGVTVGTTEKTEEKPTARLDYRKVKAQVQELQRKGEYAEAIRLLQSLSAQSPTTKLNPKDQADAEALLDQLTKQQQEATQKQETARVAREAAAKASLGADMDLIWLTDTTATPGETYRYRLRVLAVNPHAGLLAKLRKPEDAAKVILAGEWSEWSDPVTLPPTQYLFFTAVDPQNQTAKIELYNWTNGEWKKGTGTVSVGQPIQFTERYQEFSYNAVLASLESGREYEERGVDAKKGVRYRDPKPTDAAILLKPGGEAVEHLVARDMDLRRDLASELNRKKEAQPKTPGPTRPEPKPARRGGRAGFEEEPGPGPRLR